MQAEVIAAIITACAVAIGWVVAHVSTSKRERAKQELEAAIRFTERQLEELYGPLEFLRLEGQRTFKDLLDTLGRRRVFNGTELLPDAEREIWLFWAERDFMPRNEKIQQLLATNAHLIEGDQIPEAVQRFLEHHNSWRLQHLRWKEQKVDYPLHSKIDWPIEFDEHISSTFRLLKQRQTAYLARRAQYFESACGELSSTQKARCLLTRW